MKEKIKKIWSNKIVKAIVVILLFIFATGYHSIDLRMTEKAVNNYLVKYMKDKYNVNVKLVLLGKRRDKKVCLFGIDNSCAIAVNNYSVKEYQFIGEDEKGNNFYIDYKNRSIKLLLPEYEEPYINENYNRYIDLEKAKSIFNEYFDKVYVFTNIDKKPETAKKDNGFVSVYFPGETTILVGYGDKLTTDEFTKIKQNIYKNTTYSYEVIFTNDIDVFNKMVSLEDKLKAMEFPCYCNEIIDEIGVGPCESDKDENYVYNENDKYFYKGETNSNMVYIYTNNKYYIKNE